MEKVLYWKIQVVNQTPDIKVDSKEMEIYKNHYLKDYTTREYMNDVEALDHYKKNAWKNPLFSRIHSLTLAFVDGEEIRVNHFTGTERDLLVQFLNTVKSPYFNDFKIACFDAEYLLPYLGIRLDKNDLQEVIPAGLQYRGRKTWQLDSICIRDYFRGAGAYKPTLKELAYIYNLTENIDSRYDENELALTGDEVTLSNNSVEEIKVLINTHRKMSYKDTLSEIKVSISNVKDIVLEEPKSIIHELYETKNFDLKFQDRLRKHLKERKMLKREIPVVKELILASYLEKIDIMSYEKKKLQDLNEKRAKEVEEFFKTL